MKLIFNVKKILAVQVATYTVAKRRLEEIQPYLPNKPELGRQA